MNAQVAVMNPAWGRKCQLCDKPVLSNSPSTFVCAVHYIENLQRLNAGKDQIEHEFAPYNPLAPTTQVDIYVDGACEGNPGPGGYGIVMEARRYGEPQLRKLRRISGPTSLRSTNNQAELEGATIALATIITSMLDKPTLINVWCDSEYLVRGINEYIYKWMQNGWKTAKKEPVANRELWEQLYSQHSRLNFRPQFLWVKGHSVSQGNIAADDLARAAARTQTTIDKTVDL